MRILVANAELDGAVAPRGPDELGDCPASAVSMNRPTASDNSLTGYAPVIPRDNPVKDYLVPSHRSIHVLPPRHLLGALDDDVLTGSGRVGDTPPVAET